MTMPSGWKAPIETTVLETERTIWHNEITKGIFNKHIVDRQGITTTTTEGATNTTATIGTETQSSPGTFIAPSDTSSTTTSSSNQSPLYEQGYAKGVADAKLVKSSSPASTTMSPDDVDCNSDIDPQTSNEEYCSGYQHGFADTNNNELSGK
jgi:hypothetical protein